MNPFPRFAALSPCHPFVQRCAYRVGRSLSGDRHQADGADGHKRHGMDRVTRDAARAPDDGPLPVTKLFDRTSGKEVPRRQRDLCRCPTCDFVSGRRRSRLYCGAAVGAPGQTRVLFRESAASTTAWTETPWRDVDPASDFTAVFTLEDLNPGTRYEIVVEDRPRTGAPVASRTPGGFVTAPLVNADAAADASPVMSCQQYEDRRPTGRFCDLSGDARFQARLLRQHRRRGRLRPRPGSRPQPRPRALPLGADVWFAHAAGVSSAGRQLLHEGRPRHADQRFASGGSQRRFHVRRRPAGVSRADGAGGARLIARSLAAGIWKFGSLEGRDYRSTSERGPHPDAGDFGAKQMAWLEQTLAASDATFRVVITPTPMVGPDRANKDDNLANKGYVVEGTKIRSLLATHKNLTVITGDRHWQYVSKDATTGWKNGAWEPRAMPTRAAGMRPNPALNTASCARVTADFFRARCGRNRPAQR